MKYYLVKKVHDRDVEISESILGVYKNKPDIQGLPVREKSIVFRTSIPYFVHDTEKNVLMKNPEYEKLDTGIREDIFVKLQEIEVTSSVTKLYLIYQCLRGMGAHSDRYLTFETDLESAKKHRKMLSKFLSQQVCEIVLDSSENPVVTKDTETTEKYLCLELYTTEKSEYQKNVEKVLDDAEKVLKEKDIKF